MMILNNFWDLLLQSAPWLLLGYFIAGLINVYLPASSMKSQLGNSSFGHSVKAAFIGAPLPLCSCGVIPTALGLRKSGASKNATASFMVATPETGVDSVSITYALMGPFMAVFRPIAAVSSAIIAGELVRLTDDKKENQGVIKVSSCCGEHPKHTHSHKNHSHTHHGHAHGDTHSHGHAHQHESFDSNLKQLMHFSFVKMLGDTANWLLVGIFFAALVQTFVPESFLSQWGSGLLAMLVMVVVSIPMYICATASTPIAAGLLLAGVSPGAVLVFMLTGPATNLATLGVLGKELGRRALGAYLVGVIVSAIVMGFVLDWMLGTLGITIAISEHLHQHEDSVFYLVSGIILSLLMVKYYATGALRYAQSHLKSKAA